MERKEKERKKRWDHGANKGNRFEQKEECGALLLWIYVYSCIPNTSVERGECVREQGKSPKNFLFLVKQIPKSSIWLSIRPLLWPNDRTRRWLFARPGPIVGKSTTFSFKKNSTFHWKKVLWTFLAWESLYNVVDCCEWCNRFRIASCVELHCFCWKGGINDVFWKLILCIVRLLERTEVCSFCRLFGTISQCSV